jgi:RecB family exonuclease
VAFGGTWSGTASSPLDSDEPLLVAAGSRTLRMRGRIDRLDYTPGVGFRVVDYKTGKGWGLPKPGELGGGKKLQLPLYLRAGAMVLGVDAASGEAAYHVVSRAGGFKRVAFTGADLTAKDDGLQAILTRIGDGVASGDFHPEPGKDQCKYCDFDGLCDIGRDRQRERKADDERAVSFKAMSDIQ